MEMIHRVHNLSMNNYRNSTEGASKSRWDIAAHSMNISSKMVFTSGLTLTFRTQKFVKTLDRSLIIVGLIKNRKTMHIQFFLNVKNWIIQLYNLAFSKVEYTLFEIHPDDSLKLRNQILTSPCCIRLYHALKDPKAQQRGLSNRG